MKQSEVLRAENLQMTLGHGATRVCALDHVTLAMDTKELAILIGPSGSGKSTLLSILGCILRPTAGSLRIAGSVVDALSSEELAGVRRQHIGFVFQSFNLFAGLTALENVRTGLVVRTRRWLGGIDAAMGALETVGLGHRANALPGQLSGGEQQRVAIARAIVAKPSILLADEPTAALDAATGRNVMQQFNDLSKKLQCAVLVVSHDARAIPFADRVITLEDGRILSDVRNGTRMTSAGGYAHA